MLLNKCERTKFRQIFAPTKEEEIASIERLIQLHKEHIGDCSTCLSYCPTDAPGFVTDYGDCLAKSSVFEKRVCGLSNESCPLYKENMAALHMLTEKLKELRDELDFSE